MVENRCATFGLLILDMGVFIRFMGSQNCYGENLFFGYLKTPLFGEWLKGQNPREWVNPIPTGQGRDQPLYECHVTKSGRNRVKYE